MKNQPQTDKVIKMNEGQFWEQFKPIKNHIDSNASFEGCMFETFEDELKHVQAVNEKTPLNVWTISDCDGKLYIGEGFHFVNRMGYLITELPAEEGAQYVIEDEADEVFFEGDAQSIYEIDMTDIFDYDEPAEIAEWAWIEANASFSHNRNDEHGIHEFILNMSRDFVDVPESLNRYITEAKSKNIAYLIFHQGT